MSDIIKTIVENDSLSVEQKVDQLSAALGTQPDLGAAKVIKTLLATRDALVADYGANYLALLSGFASEKKAIVERFLEMDEEFIGAATNLVEFLPPELIDRIIGLYLANPSDATPLYSVIYQTAVYFPERMRAYSERIDDPALRLSMLAGGPDDWVRDLAAKYRKDRKPGWLESMGRFHTLRAARTLFELGEDVPQEDRYAWSGALEIAGLMPDGSTASVYAPALRGFVRRRGEFPHAMGGIVPGEAPLCPKCSTPADRVLTLRSASLPFHPGGALDPSFYWFGCACSTLSAILLQMVPGGVKVLVGSKGKEGSGRNIVPGELSLQLELHPAQAGFGIESAAGFGRHQVGGFPPFLNLDAFPICPLCQKIMRFLASIDSGMTPFGRMRFNGVLFGFWCSDCQTTTTVHQPQ
ncbi:hypothetical protein [Tunturiibacter lichenicola]|uniref:hypothetical protein n=1 Tax=Tunturiibacter lichenicola TaxID=2051959 RepID=UPI003D9B661D